MVIGAAIIGAAYPAAGELTLTIEPLQKAFVAGKTMEFKFTILNASNETVNTAIPQDYRKGLEIRDPDGKVIHPREETPTTPQDPTIALRKGEFLGKTESVAALLTTFEKDGWYKFTWGHGGAVSKEVSILVTKEYLAEIETNYGKITIAFSPEDAPNHVLNFVSLAKKGFYDRKIFHRIIKGFMMQGGCPNGDGTGGTGNLLKAEFNARKHVAGTVSMARKPDPDSADCQFFICFTDAPALDGRYTVFGQVVEGMNVVKEIENVKTDHVEGQQCGAQHADKPLSEVVIKKVTVIEKK